MKIVVNRCYGGFGFSRKACKMLGLESQYAYVDRTDPAVIACVEQLGQAASGSCSRLEIVEIPDNATDWEVGEYDGAESVIYVVDGKIYHEE